MHQRIARHLSLSLEWITNTNKWVEGKHDEMAKVSMSDDDLEMVGSIVEVKEFEG